jgi:hypothetical protein
VVEVVQEAQAKTENNLTEPMGFGLVVVELEFHLQLLVQAFFTLAVVEEAAMFSIQVMVDLSADLEEAAMVAGLAALALALAILQHPTAKTD